MMLRKRRGIRAVLLALSMAVPSAAIGADTSEKVSEITDSRIKESSGLVVSSKHEDLVYTINDAGNAPIVYAITLSTGDVAGMTRVDGGRIRDTESIAIDGDGTMWLSDLGDNDTKRDDAAIYALPEPGPGDHSVTAKRYPISYDTGSVDIEAFLVHPKTGAKVLASKEKKKAGTLYALPDTLSETSPNVATDLGKPVPEDVSDGTFSIDGTQALLRTRDAVHLVDPGTWQETGTLAVPKVEQGESIAMEPGGTSFIIGSEGKNSPLIRVAFGPDADAVTPPAAEKEQKTKQTSDSQGVDVPVYAVVAVGAVVVLALVATWVARRRST